MAFPFHHIVDGEGGGGDARSDLESLIVDRDGGEEEGGSDPEGAAGSDPNELNLDDPSLDDNAEVVNDPDGTDPVFEIPVGDGKTITKTQSELIAEASKYHGAEKKFAEAAAIRKDAEAKLQQVPEREKQLGVVLEHYIREHQAFLASQQPNWEALLAQDPAQYVRVRHEWEQRQQQIAQAQQIQATLNKRNADADAANLHGRLEQAKAKIIEAIPEWTDPAKATEGAQAVAAYLESQGIPKEMQAQMDTAEVFLIARKAMMFDQALARQKAAREGVKQPPRVERPGSRQPAPNRNQLARANATKTFNADPSVKNLAALLE
nr:response regulator receiver protein [Paraburkholderia sp. Ac-20340]